MKGLEAIEEMKKGKILSIEIYGIKWLNKIENGCMYAKRECEPETEWREERNFCLNIEYKEYIEPNSLNGWECVDKGKSYFIVDRLGITRLTEDNDGMDDVYRKAINYFSTKEKAEQINFEQTLFRKMRRFSDENGGDEIDWSDWGKLKFYIHYQHDKEALFISNVRKLHCFGEVYFVSYEVAERALELFRDDLLKYFTHDWSVKDE